MYIFDIHTRESKILAVLNISVSDFFFFLMISHIIVF